METATDFSHKESAKTIRPIGNKRGELIHISYASTYFNNLYADSYALIEAPEFGLRLSLESNLHIRNKRANRYIDAKELVDGAIKELEMLQINDNEIVSELRNFVPNADSWVLEIHLKDNEIAKFRVTPEFRNKALFLSVPKEKKR